MNAIRIHITVGEDRRLVIDLPDEVPLGPAELIIQPEKAQPVSARDRLMQAGILVHPDEIGISEDIDYASDEELEWLGQLAPGTPPAEVLIDEDRGPL